MHNEWDLKIHSLLLGATERRWGLPLLDNKNRRENTEMGDGVCFMNESSFPYILVICTLILISCLWEREREKRMKRGSEGEKEKFSDQESS